MGQDGGNGVGHVLATDGVMFDPVDFAANPCRKSVPQVRVHGIDPFKLGMKRHQHTAGDGAADRPAQKTAALLPHALLNEMPQVRLPGRYGGLDALKQERQNLLVHLAVHHGTHATGDQRRHFLTIEQDRKGT